MKARLAAWRERLRNNLGAAKYYLNFLRTFYHLDMAWADLQDRTTMMVSLARVEQGLRGQLEQVERLKEALISHSSALEASSHRLIREAESRLLAQLQELSLNLSGLERRGEQFEQLAMQSLHDLRAVEKPTEGAEVQLLRELYGLLPQRIAVDVGAHQGDLSDQLLDCGYQVVAFEPDTDNFELLFRRLSAHPKFTAFPWAIAARDEAREFHRVKSSSVQVQASLYGGLKRHPLVEELTYAGSSEVKACRLDSLQTQGVIPSEADLLKVDTEGLDAEVLKSLGTAWEVVCCEFWAEDFCFGPGNELAQLVPFMRDLGFAWNLVLETRQGEQRVRYRTNTSRSGSRVWGNVFFFRRPNYGLHLGEWCQRNLPPAED